MILSRMFQQLNLRFEFADYDIIFLLYFAFLFHFACPLFSHILCATNLILLLDSSVYQKLIKCSLLCYEETCSSERTTIVNLAATSSVGFCLTKASHFFLLVRKCSFFLPL